MLRPSKPRLLGVGALFCAAALSSCAFNTSVSAQSKTPSIASAVKPDAPARAVNTEELLALLKGDGKRPLLVNYWATWCDPCRDEFPDLVKIDEDFRPKGLEFITVSLDDLKDINTEVPKFLREMRARMPVYLLNVVDPEPAINAIDPAWGGAMPATFLYNSKGEVTYRHFGRFDTAELRAAIDKLVSSGEQKAEGSKQ